jgi:glycopeptide antibiotics resistance protein
MEIGWVFNLALLLLFGLIWIGAAIYLHYRKKKSAIYLLFFTIFYTYLFKVLDYTLFQFQSLVILKYFNPNLMLRGQASGESLNLIPLVGLTSQDVGTSLLNILLMVPFGFGIPFIANFRMKQTVIIGALFSIAIEIIQFVTGVMTNVAFRITDINDVLFNILGVAMGYIFFVRFVTIFRSIVMRRNMVSNPVIRHIIERPVIG